MELGRVGVDRRVLLEQHYRPGSGGNVYGRPEI